MTRLVALPHLQTDGVEPGNWLVTIRGSQQPLPQLLKGWDYETPLAFECAVTVDLDRVREECALPIDSAVAVLASWWATATNRRERGGMVRVLQSGDVDIAFEVDPAIAGGTLVLERRLVLVQAGDQPAPFSATVAGSVLWQEGRSEQASVVLEGEAARFPTELIDFSGAPIAEPEAAWWLEFDLSDLEASPLAVMRLYLNSSNPLVLRLVAGEDRGDVKLLGDVLNWDVARRLIGGALESSEFCNGWGHFRQGSIGEALELLIRRLWPSHDAASLSSLKSADDAIFEARLQGRVQMVGAMP